MPTAKPSPRDSDEEIPELEGGSDSGSDTSGDDGDDASSSTSSMVGTPRGAERHRRDLATWSRVGRRGKFAGLTR
jgi:hypothetical protein